MMHVNNPKHIQRVFARYDAMRAELADIQSALHELEDPPPEWNALPTPQKIAMLIRACKLASITPYAQPHKDATNAQKPTPQ